MKFDPAYARFLASSPLDDDLHTQLEVRHMLTAACMEIDRLKPAEQKTIVKNHCIALTGGIGTGKSTVAQYLRENLYLVLDADKLSRQVVLPGSLGLSEIVHRFGKDVLKEDGTLDRRKLGNIIFNDHEKKRQLEAIVHPKVEREFLRFMDTPAVRTLVEHKGIFFYENPLLHELGSRGDYREVWCTFCSTGTQIERVMKRDSSTAEEALAVIGSQYSAAQKALNSHRLIVTDSPDLDLAHQIDNLLENLESSLP